MVRFAALALALATLLAFGCTAPRTEVILAVDLDARAEAMVDRLSVEVIDPTGMSRFATAPISELPRTLGLSWSQGPLGPFTVRVIGERRATPLITRIARFTFVRGETHVLRIVLTGNCIGQACSASQTCAASGCRSWEIEPGEFEPWTGSISRPDGGLDAGPVDAFTPRFDAWMPLPDVRIQPDVFADDPDAFIDDPDAFIDDPDAFVNAPDAFVPNPDAADPGSLDACMPRPETCNGLDDNCNGAADETFDLNTDRNHCGRCGNACMLPNASDRCRGGMCEIRMCDMAFEDCDRDVTNGCEANVTRDPRNCRVCGNACGGATPLCCRGVCAASCM